MSSKNEGIIVKGGNIHAEQIAVGSDSTAIKIVTRENVIEVDRSKRAKERLEELRKAVIKNSASVKNQRESKNPADESSPISAEAATPRKVTGIL